MKRMLLAAAFSLLACSVQAGFGIQAGAFSPTSGLDDNDNTVLFGGHFKAKLATFGIKGELFFLDSSGRYGSRLGDEFGGASIDIENIAAVDLMFYPLGTTFFLQVGVNYTNLDITDVDSGAIENELGIEGGAGITLFDKLLVQGKVMYTPNAIKSDVADSLRDLDENLFGFMVTVGWEF